MFICVLWLFAYDLRIQIFFLAVLSPQLSLTFTLVNKYTWFCFLFYLLLSIFFSSRNLLCPHQQHGGYDFKRLISLSLTPLHSSIYGFLVCWWHKMCTSDWTLLIPKWRILWWETKYKEEGQGKNGMQDIKIEGMCHMMEKENKMWGF